MKTFKNFAFVAIMMAGAAVSFSSCNGGPLADEPRLISSSIADPSTIMVVMRSTVKDPFNELSKNQLHTLGFTVNDASTKVLYKAYRAEAIGVKEDFVKKIKERMNTQLNLNPGLKNTNVKVEYTVTVTYNNYYKRTNEKISGTVFFNKLS